MDDFKSTSEKEWVQRRVSAVSKRYSAYQALTDNGVEILDEATSIQLFCPFHDNKHTPAARYYAASGNNDGHFYCFSCKIRLDGIGLFSRFNNIPWFEALSKLEKKFGINIPKVDLTSPIAIVDRGEGYKSSARSDIPRMLTLLESKLTRCRSKASLPEYVRVCRVLDEIEWNFDISGKADENMITSISRAEDLMNDVMNRPEDPLDS